MSAGSGSSGPRRKMSLGQEKASKRVMSRAWCWERNCGCQWSMEGTVPGAGQTRVRAGAGTCLAALSHEGLQAHAGVVIDQVDAVPTIQARAGLALVHLCKRRPGGVVSPHTGTARLPVHPLPPILDDARDGEGDVRGKKVSTTSNAERSPPKTMARGEAGWEGSLPRCAASLSLPGARSCHPPVWQSVPMYPGWHKHAAIPFTAWHLPPFWHTLLSHGDSSAVGHQKKERKDQPRRRTGRRHPLHGR